MMDWSQAFAAGSAVAGGKGWNLSRLHRYGFPVPAGGVLPAQAYREACAGPAVASKIQTLAGVAPESAMEEGVQALLASVREAIREGGVPAPWREALADRPAGPVAVRSSAVAEDGATASFAGIHESRLDVEDVEAAVLDCWASLWTPRALAYRRRLGLSDDQVACAVVICAMVPAVCAGVAFTCDPASGRRDLAVLEAAPGLGDALVRGDVTPEQVVLRRVRGVFRVERRTGSEVLTDEQALRLARLAWRVLWALGEGQDPQDLEWAWDGDRFWLLQSRPVTRLPHCTFPAVRHLPVWWSNANMKDAVPGVVSHLAWSAIHQAIPDVLYAVPHVVGYPVPPGMEISRRFEGRAYFDFTGMQWGFYDSIGMPPEETVRAIGGHQPAIPIPPGDPMKGPDGRRRTRARLKMLKALWGFEGRLKREIRRHYEEVRAIVPHALGAATLAEFREMQERLDALHDRLDPLVGLANISSGGWHQALEAQLRAVAGPDALALQGRLLVGSGGVESAEHGYRTFDLAQTARGDAEARRWLESDAPASSWRDLPAGSAFRAELARFLEDYGHRGVYEADVMNPRWAEDPGYILDQVREILEADPPEPPRERARRVREEGERDLRRRGGWRTPLVRFLLGRVASGLALREAAKSAMCSTLLPGRRIALEIGRRLVEAGHLAACEDVFHLVRPDVEALLAGEWEGQGAGNLARDRAAAREEWLGREVPDVLLSEGSAWSGWADAPLPPSEGLLTGLAVAPGTAEGAARLLHHPHEGGRLGRGEILVAPSTDPGWTPLFLKAGGIVMESGGYLSHGAIVAREYGIPAVTNVAGVLERLQDGNTVRVDGNHGTVEVLRSD